MKHLRFRFAIALFTFLIGVAVAPVGVIKRRSHALVPSQASDCIPMYDPLATNHLREDDDPKVLAAFNEISLEALPACVDESYRLLWFPTFHPPVVVRLWRSGDKYFVVSKQLSGRGGYDIGNLDIEQTRPLTQNEWFGFMKLLNGAPFWELPSTVSEPLINDGALWIVEGANASKYHRVRRRLPASQYADICKNLIKLSGLQTQHDLYLP